MSRGIKDVDFLEMDISLQMLAWIDNHHEITRAKEYELNHLIVLISDIPRCFTLGCPDTNNMT